MTTRIDDETLRTAILYDVRFRRIFPWPAQSQNGKLVEAHALLTAIQHRTGDASITTHDLDQAMRRLRAHRLNFPLSRALRFTLRSLLRSDRPRSRPPAYFVDDWTWRRELLRLPRDRRSR